MRHPDFLGPGERAQAMTEEDRRRLRRELAFWLRCGSTWSGPEPREMAGADGRDQAAA
jgi:hypothetical protein